MLEHFGAGAGEPDAASLQHHAVTGHAQPCARVLLDEQDCLALGVHFLDGAEHDPQDLRRQAHRRLVEYDHGRIKHQAARKFYEPLLAARQIPCFIACSLANDGEKILHIGQSRLPLAVTGAPGGGAVTVNSKDSFHLELGGGQAAQQKARRRLLDELAAPTGKVGENELVSFVQRQQVQTLTAVEQLRELHKGLKVSSKGPLLALVTMVGFGIAIAGIAYLAGRCQSFMVPVLTLRCCIFVQMAALAGVKRQGCLPGVGLGVVLGAMAVGLLDTGSLLALAQGMVAQTDAKVALLGPLYGAYPVVTILLTLLFLREKLVANQWAGVGLVMVGTFIVAL